MDDNSGRTWSRHPTSTGIGVGRVCAHCGLRGPPGDAQGALLPDATVIDPEDRGRDGRRYVTACGSEHLQILIDRARLDWVDDELWFGMLCRASSSRHMVGAPLSELGGSARLSPEHLSRALNWNARNASPRVTLPGGQILPTRRASADSSAGSDV